MYLSIYRAVGLRMICLTALLFLCVSVYGTDNRFTVVIDAGHGGKDVGAVDNDVREKDINLSVAIALESLLKKKAKDVHVVMTRDKDEYLTLQQRADKANKTKGDLFISIHTNSVDKSNKNRTTVAGASTYTLGLHKDQSNMDVARRENSVMRLESNFETKYSGFDPASDESYIIFEMAQKETMSHSIKFADEVQKNMVKVASRRDRGVHQAGFWVLWATAMPAVLIELDFICNPESAKFMTSDSGQKQFANAIYNAIISYKDKLSKKQVAPLASTQESDAGQEIVLSSITTKPKKNSATYEIPQNSSSSLRRRRSDASRAVSSQREIDVAVITNQSQSDLLSGDYSPEEKQEVSSSKTTTQRTSKNVKENIKNDTKKESIARLDKKKTIYKIQILASQNHLKSNNPRFCGLSPISCIQENNMYKYTYGESDNRAEIEKMLIDVRKKFPDAFIIQIRKGVKTILK